jgi:TetR/AcrR family transcriptional regulator, transcriptional repressor for nem operon
MAGTADVQVGIAAFLAKRPPQFTGNGCLIDNFSAEASEHSEVIRKRSSGLRGNAPIGRILFESPVKSGDLSHKNDCDELAGFVIASLQGAFLQSEVERAVPIERFKHLLFSTILQ